MRIPCQSLGLLALLGVPASALADGHAPGAVIPDAAEADVSDDGFNALGDMLPALLPSRVDIPATGDDAGYYSYDLSGGWVGITVTDGAIVPGNGVLQLDADLSIQVNDAWNPFRLEYSVVWLFSDTCYGYVQPFPAEVSVPLYLEVAEGPDGRYLDATVGTINVSYGLTTSHIILQECAIDDLESVLSFFGLSIYQMVIDYADEYLRESVADMATEIEATIEDAFASASLDETFEVGDAALHVTLEPSDVEISPAGARIHMEGSADGGAPNACVAEWDPGTSPETASSPPAMESTPSGIPPAWHVGILLSDDFANQAFYALWRAGILCYTIDENFESFPVSTDILGMLDDEAFGELFPETAPLVIQTRPRVQPVVDYSGTHDLDVAVDELGLDFVAEVDGRLATVLGLELSADAGIDLVLDGGAGVLDILVDLDPANVTTTVRSAELTPDAAEDIEANFGSLLGTILDTVVAGQLEDLSFSLPAYEGLGLVSLDVAATGSGGDWLGIYGNVGAVSYTGSGCGEDGGCSSGCATGRGPAPLAGLALAGLLLVRRRRRD